LYVFASKNTPTFEKFTPFLQGVQFQITWNRLVVLPKTWGVVAELGGVENSVYG